MGSNCPVLYPPVQERHMTPLLYSLHSIPPHQPWVSLFPYLVIGWGTWQFHQPPTLYQAVSEWHMEKGEGLILGPDERIDRLSPCTCPPGADAHLGISKLETREDSLGCWSRQPRCPQINPPDAPPYCSVMAHTPQIPVSFASRNFGSIVLAGLLIHFPAQCLEKG